MVPTGKFLPSASNLGLAFWIQLSGKYVLQIGVAARSFNTCRHADAGLRVTRYPSETFVVAEKEDFVFDDRTTDGGSELVLAQLALFDSRIILKPVGSIELVVAEKLPRPRRGCYWYPS